MGDGPPGFPQDFSCPVVLGWWNKEADRAFAYGAVTPYGRTFQSSSASPPVDDSPVPLRWHPSHSRYTADATAATLTRRRFGLIPVRSPLLGESRLLSFPQATEMVHFAWLAPRPLWIQGRVIRHDPDRVAPFGDPRIKACLRLTEAYRSLPRPSSPSCA